MTTSRATAESYAALKFCQAVKKQAKLAKTLNSTAAWHAKRGEDAKASKILLKKAMIDQDLVGAEALFDRVPGVGSEALKYLYLDGKSYVLTGHLIGYSPDHVKEIAREARKDLFPMLPEAYKKSAQA